MKTRLQLLGIWLVLIAGCLIAMIAFPIYAMIWPSRAWDIAIMEDDAGNQYLFGRLGRTISSHAAHAERNGQIWGCVLCRLLDQFQRGHCRRALTAHDQNLR